MPSAYIIISNETGIQAELMRKSFFFSSSFFLFLSLGEISLTLYFFPRRFSFIFDFSHRSSPFCENVLSTITCYSLHRLFFVFFGPGVLSSSRAFLIECFFSLPPSFSPLPPPRVSLSLQIQVSLKHSKSKHSKIQTDNFLIRNIPQLYPISRNSSYSKFIF